LLSPPRNAAGQVEPHDHSGILARDGVIRRISRQYVILDKDGRQRVSTMAFTPSSAAQGGGLSVDLQREIEESGLDTMKFVTNPPWIGSVRFTAQQLRDEGFRVGFDPLPPGNPFHGEVWGRFTKGKQKQLLRLAQWFVAIPGVGL
jgi:hypothetical protein